MPSSYLSAEEYAAFGVPNTDSSQVTLACAAIDAYLCRPEGLVWMPDASGRPAYMAAASAQVVLAASSPFEAGQSVSVQVSGPSIAQPGDVVIVDRGDESRCEACQIIATAAGSITLATVLFDHSASSTIEFGLVIREERKVAEDRPMTMLSRPPVVALLGGQGRYGYSRRGTQNRYAADEYNLLASVGSFGGPPAWQIFQTKDADVNPTTGEVWVPAGIMLAYYSEVRLHYVAGFPADGVPYEVKQACANLIQAKGNLAALNGNIQTLTMGTTRITRFANTLLDDDTKHMLTPFRARMFG